MASSGEIRIPSLLEVVPPQVREELYNTVRDLTNTYGDDIVARLLRFTQRKLFFEENERFVMYDGFYVNFKTKRLHNDGVPTFSIDVSELLCEYIDTAEYRLTTDYRKSVGHFLAKSDAHRIFRKELERLQACKLAEFSGSMEHAITSSGITLEGYRDLVKKRPDNNFLKGEDI